MAKKLQPGEEKIIEVSLKRRSLWGLLIRTPKLISQYLKIMKDETPVGKIGFIFSMLKILYKK